MLGRYASVMTSVHVHVHYIIGVSSSSGIIAHAQNMQDTSDKVGYLCKIGSVYLNFQVQPSCQSLYLKSSCGAKPCGLL